MIVRHRRKHIHQRNIDRGSGEERQKTRTRQKFLPKYIIWNKFKALFYFVILDDESILSFLNITFF